MSSLIRGCVLICSTILIQAPVVVAQQHWLNDAFPPEQRTHDFGTVARAAKTEHRFLIKNTSGQTIELGGIRTSCGCTTPTIETKTIQPGATGSIHARFNTGSFTGQKQATVTVTVVKPVFTEIQLVCKGYIRSDVVVNPGAATFGELTEGEGKSITLSIDYAGRQDWAIENVSSELDFVNASVKEVSRGNGRIKYDLTVDLDEDAPVGFVNNQILLETNDRRLKSVPVALTANIQPTVQFSPAELTLGDVKPGQAISKRIVVKGKKPFRILEISSAEVQVEFEPSDTAKPAHMVNVKLSPNEKTPGQVAGKILLKTDLQEEPLAMDLSYSMEKLEIPTSTKKKVD